MVSAQYPDHSTWTRLCRFRVTVFSPKRTSFQVILPVEFGLHHLLAFVWEHCHLDVASGGIEQFDQCVWVCEIAQEGPNIGQTYGVTYGRHSAPDPGLPLDGASHTAPLLHACANGQPLDTKGFQTDFTFWARSERDDPTKEPMTKRQLVKNHNIKIILTCAGHHVHDLAKKVGPPNPSAQYPQLVEQSEGSCACVLL